METKEIQPPSSTARRHVVILGAGASKACCLNGDANGRVLPVFADFIDTLNLRPVLIDAGVFVEGENFENLYSRLAIEGKHPGLLKMLESEVFRYFSELQLPTHPTLYDHLLLSLRPKDFIATFNWDPFLVQAFARCKHLADMPKCLYLHGNVAVGSCLRHEQMSIGDRGGNCRQCGEPLIGSKLLYPVTQKNYSSDPLISKSWEFIQQAIEECFLLTLFGYSAPATDLDAIGLLKEAWGDVNDRSMEETEIIDIRPEEELCTAWDSFIHTHHYQVHASFYDSILGNLPRRSVEMMFREIYDAEFIEYTPLPKEAGWDELAKWIRPYVDQERNKSS